MQNGDITTTNRNLPGSFRWGTLRWYSIILVKEQDHNAEIVSPHCKYNFIVINVGIHFDA